MRQGRCGLGTLVPPFYWRRSIYSRLKLGTTSLRLKFGHIYDGSDRLVIEKIVHRRFHDRQDDLYPSCALWLRQESASANKSVTSRMRHPPVHALR